MLASGRSHLNKSPGKSICFIAKLASAHVQTTMHGLAELVTVSRSRKVSLENRNCEIREANTAEGRFRRIGGR